MGGWNNSHGYVEARKNEFDSKSPFAREKTPFAVRKAINFSAFLIA